MKNWKCILAIAVLMTLFGLYIKGYTYGVSSDNSNIRLKQEVDMNNPVLNDIVYNYYICVEDEYIVVYKADRKTVYMDTGININSVDTDDVEALEKGIPVEDITKLYGYLESFTS